MRISYFYFMKDVPDRIRLAAPEHAAYWQALRLADYQGGPFGDRSGGLITFTARDKAEAELIVRDDPFIREGLLENHWLKEWIVDR